MLCYKGAKLEVLDRVQCCGHKVRMISALICVSLRLVWHLYNLPCASAYFYCKIKYLILRDKIWCLLWTCSLLAFYIVTQGSAVSGNRKTAQKYAKNRKPHLIFFPEYRNHTSSSLSLRRRRPPLPLYCIESKNREYEAVRTAVRGNIRHEINFTKSTHHWSKRLEMAVIANHRVEF